MTYEEFKEKATVKLIDWGLHTPAVVELLAMICAHESLGGKHLRQIGGGPALGLFQIERITHDSIWDNSDTMHGRALKFGIKRNTESLLDFNYSLFVARHYLLMDKNPLPITIKEMANYCKSYWNRTGKATPEKYLTDWEAWKCGNL